MTVNFIVDVCDTTRREMNSRYEFLASFYEQAYLPNYVLS